MARSAANHRVRLAVAVTERLKFQVAFVILVSLLAFPIGFRLAFPLWIDAVVSMVILLLGVLVVFVNAQMTLSEIFA
jgi:hypothetical protein